MSVVELCLRRARGKLGVERAHARPSRCAWFLLRTYTCDAGSLPTSTVARPGTDPPARTRSATPAATSSRTRAETRGAVDDRCRHARTL